MKFPLLPLKQWVFATWTWLLVAQAAPVTPAQQAWLKGFEGTWVIDNPRGSEADLTLAITREGNALVLRSVFGSQQVETRYDVSGADVTNTNFGRKAILRTRIDGQKLVTDIWDGEAVGPPARIETRFLESADRMVTELTAEAGAPPFQRVALRRKP